MIDCLIGSDARPLALPVATKVEGIHMPSIVDSCGNVVPVPGVTGDSVHEYEDRSCASEVQAMQTIARSTGCVAMPGGRRNGRHRIPLWAGNSF